MLVPNTEPEKQSIYCLDPSRKKILNDYSSMKKGMYQYLFLFDNVFRISIIQTKCLGSVSENIRISACFLNAGFILYSVIGLKLFC